MHLLSIEPKYHEFIREKIEEQLRFDPLRATRNRKSLRQPAPFEATGNFDSGPTTASVCCMALTKNVGRCRSRPSE